MKRKIAAIFAADIAGYSRLVAEDEEETLRRLASYRAVTDDFIAKSGGRIFNTAGDAVLDVEAPDRHDVYAEVHEQRAHIELPRCAHAATSFCVATSDRIPCGRTSSTSTSTANATTCL